MHLTPFRLSIMGFLTVEWILLLVPCANALVTLRTVRDWTVLTDECRERVEGVVGEVRFVRQGEDERLGRFGGDGRDDVEETIIAALNTLNAKILEDLEVPVDGLRQGPLSQAACKSVITAHHNFLRSTTKFLYAIQERQMRYRWGSESPVLDGMAWLQSLWASRSANNQHLSLIEQHLTLYKATTCFGKEINKKVLRPDVEIVEYLNELIDSFN